MKQILLLSIIMVSISTASCQTNKYKHIPKLLKKQSIAMNYNELTPEEEYIIVNKGTERPYTGKYTDNKDKGVYTCKRCDAPLYVSDDKFDSRCGWPSFDDEIEGAVRRLRDADGIRTEIVCSRCDAHLGHVFLGEGFTSKNTRHCVNSISLNFVPAGEYQDVRQQKAIFAGGCFWGVEYYLKRINGVISTSVGYIGGAKDNPTYKEVSYTPTGHAEAVEVVFDADQVSYEQIAKVFFETHDPTQVDRQGPDVGKQYRSEIFYVNDKQKKIAEELIQELRGKGYDVATKLTPATTFWKAEDYHQDYYDAKGGTPYCHVYQSRF